MWIIILVFVLSVGGSYSYIRLRQKDFEKEVNASPMDKKLVIPGGMPIGIYLETKGVMVLGTDAIEREDGVKENPSSHLVKAGDYIQKVNNATVKTKNELIEEMKKLKEEEVVLTIRRNRENIRIKTKAVRDVKKEYKLGIWVRDNAQGLGTITYLDADSHFGALGHGIHDVDTNKLLSISEGRVYATSIRDIQKGKYGTPGGMEGIIVYNNYNVLGKIKKNTEAGIFGTIDRVDVLFANQTPVQLAKKEEVEEGPAIIRCAVDGEIKEYDILITQVNLWSGEVNKSMTIEVTDPSLLDETGGIIQGMSGSPILQNGKLIGAVTHVFVNNPTKGYGIFAESMINESE